VPYYRTRIQRHTVSQNCLCFAAAIMKVHPKTLQKLARKGIVRGIHIGKLWRFRASTIEEWIEQQLAG
jgi:excisionase family DNA binding protein